MSKHKINWGDVFAESFIQVYESKVVKTFNFLMILFCLMLAIVTVGWIAVDIFKAIFMGGALEALVKPVVLLVVCEVLFPVVYVGSLICAVLALGIRNAYLLLKAEEAPKTEEVKEEAPKAEETPKEESAK